MINFLVRRLLLAIPVLFGILLVTFALGRLIPGDPCMMALGEHFTPEGCFRYRERTGLNDSIPVQFVRYLGNMAAGTWEPLCAPASPSLVSYYSVYL